ncbi:MAG: glycoside hydrolase family 127 protein [Defluviitaleaceae bacterium]|nr:glycoside hydrolase family 127 protein [Defluviitaleaceae bacterium]
MNFKIIDRFISPYQKLVQNVVIPYQEKILNDEIPNIEKSHVINNFKYAAELIETGKTNGEFYGMIFQDSDAAKWLEAAAYSLGLTKDAELEKRCDVLIDLIGRAQHPDGYLNTYFTLKGMEKRWTNLCEAHEMYCAGHMMEAAVAYAKVTGKDKLIKIMENMADHIYERFITDGTEGYPGHPEIELAFMRMYDYTGNKKYLELAGHFINVRGVNPHFYGEEYKRSGWYVWGAHIHEPDYAQNNKPVRELTEATGHSVRAVYLYTAMADYARVTGDEALKNACEILWKNITQKRMYVTGAIGSAYEGEAFTADYHLPNDTAYAETCASIGLIFFARKMLALEKRGEYADVMERALYNCVLAGMQSDGTRFFYVNPLEVVPGISGAVKTHRHTLPERPTWFTCACCPPNVARLLASLNDYAWSAENGVIHSHLFIGGELDISGTHGGKVTVETDYPNGGEIRYTFKPDGEAMDITLAVRLPAWSKNTEIRFNGEAIKINNINGYVYIKKPYKNGDVLTVNLDMGIHRIYANPKVYANNGKTAFSRGPFIYCAEGADNDGEVLNLFIDKKRNAALIDDNKITADGYRVKNNGALYSFDAPLYEPYTITLTPYYTWGNRGLNEMRVWLPSV